MSRFDVVSRPTKAYYLNSIAWTQSPMLISLSLPLMVMYLLLYVTKYDAATPARSNTTDYIVSCLEGLVLGLLMERKFHRTNRRLSIDTCLHVSIGIAALYVLLLDVVDLNLGIVTTQTIGPYIRFTYNCVVSPGCDIHIQIEYCSIVLHTHTMPIVTIERTFVVHWVDTLIHTQIDPIVQRDQSMLYKVITCLVGNASSAILTWAMDLLFATPFICILMWIAEWVHESHIESVYYGRYNRKVRMSLILGFTLFLVSEAVLFSGFFWVFFDRAFALPSYIPLMHTIEHINRTGAPLFGTMVLLLSGYYANQAYYVTVPTDAPVTGEHQSNKHFNFRWAEEYYHSVSVLLGIIFLTIQIAEYQLLPSGISYNAYFSIFFVLTGFHGVHVVVGIVLLCLCHGTGIALGPVQAHRRGWRYESSRLIRDTFSPKTGHTMTFIERWYYVYGLVRFYLQHRSPWYDIAKSILTLFRGR